MAENNLKTIYLEGGRNCAEAVFLTACAEYGVDLKDNENAVKAVGVFGGGIGCGRICGVAAGGACAIGVKYGTGHARNDNEMKKRAKRFIEGFIETFGSELCGEIKPKYNTPDLKCYTIVEKAYDILKNCME